MIGIDIGSTAITSSAADGVRRHPHAMPIEFACRVGDDVPCVLLGESGFELKQAHEVYADAVAETLARHQETDLAETSRAAVAVPGWWTPRALSWLGRALEDCGLGDVLLVNDAEAAVRGHRSSGAEVPDTVAVISLGAEVSSIVIVESCRQQGVAIRSPALVHVAGGDRLDGAVLHHLMGGLADLGVSLDVEDPDVVAAARTVLDQCRDVRESLSVSAVETMRPNLPGVSEPRIRLVRSELEELAEPWCDALVRMADTALEQYAGTVDALLLVGGLAAMPLVSQRLSADLGLEVVVAQGAATVVARGAGIRAVPAPSAPPARRSWLRRIQPALPLGRSAPSRGERRHRRTAQIDHPAVAALPAGRATTTGPPQPASPTSQSDGAHVAAMVVPADASSLATSELPKEVAAMSHGPGATRP